jgi:GDP-mannose transporter
LLAGGPAPFSLLSSEGKRSDAEGNLAVGLLIVPMFLAALVVAFYYLPLSGASQDKAFENKEGEGAAEGMLRPSEPETAPEEVAEVKTEEGVRQQASLTVIICFVVAGSVCASMLTLVNKWALRSFHKPTPPGSTPEGYLWSLVVIQFLFAALVARLAGASGSVNVTALEYRKAVAFFPAAGMFMLTIAAGNAVMNFSNVNTFLVLRSLVPLPCSLAETILYSEPWPPGLSGVALLVTVGGAIGYSMQIGGFELRSVSWAVIYLVMMPIDGLLIKHSISSLDISPWGLVYYNNLLAALPAIVYVLLFEATDWASFSTICEAAASSEARLAIIVSCVMGVAISYFQLNTRYYISATAFMVLGVVNKFATVLVNNVINEHQGWGAFVCILASLGGAVMWQLTIKSGSIKVRNRDSSWEQNAYMPFGLIICGLIWAGFVEWHQISMESHH